MISPHPDAPDAQVVLADIREQPLSTDEVLAAVADPHAGAVVLFVGHVRDHDGGRSVARLEYSSHPSAVGLLREAALITIAEYADSAPVVRVAVLHRVGRLEIGDLAIVAAVSAAHRAAAFQVGQALVFTKR